MVGFICNGEMSCCLTLSDARRWRKSIRARASKYREHSHGNQSSARVALESKPPRCPCIAPPEPGTCGSDPPPPPFSPFPCPSLHLHHYIHRTAGRSSLSPLPPSVLTAASRCFRRTALQSSIIHTEQPANSFIHVNCTPNPPSNTALILRHPRRTAC